MRPNEFNEWRKENDLPRLFDILHHNLNGFKEWIDTFGLNKDIFINAPRTGELFTGKEIFDFVSYTCNKKKKFIIKQSSINIKKILEKESFIHNVSVIKFIPFLHWAEKNIDKIGSVPKIEYTKWDESGELSNAYLLNWMPALKLGQIKLKADKEIQDRNLDFTDLDSITFSGFIVSKPATIRFASCRNWKINNESRMFGVTVEKCCMFRLECLNAYLAMNFLHCQIFEPSFNGTYFYELSIIKSMLLNPQLDKTEVVNFKYVPLENPRCPQNEKDNYRRFRFSFQGVGNLNEAKKCYYNEKCSEREIFFEELKKNNDIPEKTNNISFWTKVVRNVLILNFKENNQQAKRRFRRYIYSSFQYYLWGYGEKPINIIKISAYIIAAFSVLFFLFDLTVDSKTQFNPINSIYFSIVTFTTLGYGDIQPSGVIAKILCGAEALTGALMIGLSIAGFSNKSSY